MSPRGLRALCVVAVAGAFLLAAPAAGAYIYWTDNGPGITGGGTTIGRANLDGNAVQGSFVTSASSPGAVLSNGSHIYWGNSGGTDSIARANPDGSGVNESFITGVQVTGLTSDGTYLYWTDGVQYVGRANLDGTGANAHFINLGTSTYPEGIAATGGTLYIGEMGKVVDVPASGVGVSTLVSPLDAGSGQPTGIVAENGYLYFAELNTGGGSSSIGRVALTGAGLDESFIPNLQFPTGIASDGTHLYWVDHGAGAIGRADITSSSATSIQPTFISDTGGPWGIAVDGLIDPTTTAVSCSPATVATGDPSVCTALVSDSASSETPTGSVIFAGAGVFFPGGTSCTLTAHTGGGAACTVGAESGAAGVQSLTASYSGDPTHAASSGGGQFCAGGTSACGGGGATSGTGSGTGGGGGTSGGGTSTAATPRCKVPKVKGKTLAQARRMLAAAHCALGKVSSPRTRKRRMATLVVGRQSPVAGATLAAGAKVSLTLVVKPPPARKRRRHR